MDIGIKLTGIGKNKSRFLTKCVVGAEFDLSALKSGELIKLAFKDKKHRAFPIIKELKDDLKITFSLGNKYRYKPMKVKVSECNYPIAVGTISRKKELRGIGDIICSFVLL